jgi:hypothetical protein
LAFVTRNHGDADGTIDERMRCLTARTVAGSAVRDDTAMKKINIEVPPLGAYARWLLWVFAALTLGAVVHCSQAQALEPKLRIEMIDHNLTVGDWKVGLTKQIKKVGDEPAEEKLYECYLETITLDSSARFTFLPTRSIIPSEREPQDKVFVTLKRRNTMSDNVIDNVTVIIDIDGKIVQLPGKFGQPDKETHHTITRDKAFLILISMRANRRVQILGGAVNFTLSLNMFDEVLDNLGTCIAKLG